MRIRSIVYDFDGVICDSVSVKTEAFAEMYRQYGDDVVEKVVNYHHENGGISRFEKFKYYEKAFFNKVIKESEAREMGDLFSALAMQRVIDAKYIDGAHEFIAQHHSNYLQFICTGTPEVEIQEIARCKGITSFFKAIYGAPQTKYTILTQIMDQYNLQPKEVLFMGDAMTDYNAAKVTGVVFVGLLNEITSFPEGTITISNFKDPKLSRVLRNNL
ncbi:MAG: HAD family hydrolase [Sphingobacteriaceae bacterium]|nr:HAD family hydrolase [Sphingobacteriaceae bacterium]